jgi:hypothetical protein
MNGTNRYQLPLLIFTTMDRNRKLQAIAQAILPDETIPSHSWALTQFLACMGHNENLSILTDFDRAVDAAMEDVLPGAAHLLCTWHQSECIWKNCRSKRGNGFERFKRNFFNVRDSFSEEEFEEKWKSLLASYPVVSNYLSGTWYSVGSKWANAWTQKRFSAGMKTTSGAESINSVVRRVMKCNTNSTLVQVYQAFDEYLDTKMETEQHASPSPLINPGPTFRVV